MLLYQPEAGIAARTGTALAVAPRNDPQLSPACAALSLSQGTAMAPLPQPGIHPQTSGRWSQLVWLPIPLFVLTIAILWAGNSHRVYESQLLLMLSNVVFSTVSSLLVVVLVARSFLACGTPELLLFICGILLWGAAGTLGPALLTPDGNVAVATHNILACLSAFFQLAGALLTLNPRRPFRARRLPLAAAYLGVLGMVFLVVQLVSSGRVPLFFVQGVGGTPLRQAVLASAIVMFSGAAIILRGAERHAPNLFAKWYVPALSLIAAGLFGALLQSVHGSALNWVARLAQLLAGAYLLAAAWASLRESREQNFSLVMNENWQANEFWAKLRQQTPMGFVLRYALPFALVALAMGIRLLLESWGGPGLPTYITFYPAVMSAALLAGFGPGLLTTVLAGLATLNWLLPPAGQLGFAATIDRVGLILFLVMGAFICEVIELYRRNRDKVFAFERDAALRESDARLRFALETCHIGAWDLNLADHRALHSIEHDRIFGYPGQLPEWSYERFLEHVLPEDVALVEDRFRQLADIGSDCNFECRIRRADGEVRWVWIAGRHSNHLDGVSHRVAGIIQDITERKLFEEALNHLNEELEIRGRERTRELAVALETLQAETAERVRAMENLREKERLLIQQSRQAAMGEMIGNIAHQWRQPLNILGMFVQQLLLVFDRGNFSREFLVNSVNSSMEQIRHMSKTIDDFRNYFRHDKEMCEFRLSDVIAVTLSLVEAGFRNEHIRIECIAKDDPVITGFRNEFAQVILNILNNARDAIIEKQVSDPRVTITLSTEGDRSVVSIADNAGGIPEEIMDRIFDPYFTTKGPQTGTGVGLFMAKSIIEKNMGGRIAVRNTANGAEFRIEV